MKYYSIIGTNNIVVDSSSNPVCPKGYIEMLSDLPSDKHISKEDGTWELSLESVKEEYISTILYPQFKAEKEAIVWADGYGYDCEAVDTANWNAALKLAEKHEKKGTGYQVWINEKDKDFIWRTVDDLYNAGFATREQQTKAYVKFKELKKKVMQAQTIKEVESIKW